MSFLQSILTEKQLANFIFFGLWLGPLTIGGIIAQIYLQIVEEKARLAQLRGLRALARSRPAPLRRDVGFL